MRSRPDAGPRTAGSIPWMVLTGGVLFTVAAATFINASVRDRDRARFDNVVHSAQDLILGRLDLYMATLRGGAALFSALDTVTQADFGRYMGRLEIQTRYPGIQGIGWTERVSRREPGDSAGDPAADSATDAGETHAIRYLEPLDDRNRAALGFDMFSEPTRRAAMAAARDLGDPVLSGRVTLVQEIFGRQQAGFLLYVPVYAGGGRPIAAAARREALRGFVYAPFRADDFFAGVFGTEFRPRVSFRVYDGIGADPDRLLHASPARPGYEPGFTETRTLNVIRRPWTIVYASTPDFDAASTSFLPPVILAIGLLASLWLFGLARGLIRARVAAEGANRAKSEFLATMSHELRTPLNAIAGYVDLMDLEIAGALTQRQREFLDRIRRAQKHLLGLINDVLNFAKLEAGRVEVRRRAVDLVHVVDEAEALISPQFAGRGLSYRRAGGPPIKVLADGEKLRQVLLNLLSNALKFTDPGGEVVLAWELGRAKEGGREVRIHVADTGIGIPADRLEAIFDPFVQVDPDFTRTRHGTGLGLAISRELARAMGGDLTVRSTPGEGSRFTVTLEEAHAGADAPRHG